MEKRRERGGGVGGGNGRDKLVERSGEERKKRLGESEIKKSGEWERGEGMDRGGDKEERKGAPLRTKLGSARGIINQRAGGAGLFKPSLHRNHHHLDYDDYEFLYSPPPPILLFHSFIPKEAIAKRWLARN